jgi:hypothetical protein
LILTDSVHFGRRLYSHQYSSASSIRFFAQVNDIEPSFSDNTTVAIFKGM